MRVELLYFDGCPSYERLLPRLRELVAESAPGAEVELRRVESIDDAERMRFIGSPTVRVDGMDVDPTASKRDDFGLQCRLYRTGEGTAPVPPDDWIRHALAKRHRDHATRIAPRAGPSIHLRGVEPPRAFTPQGPQPCCRGSF